MTNSCCVTRSRASASMSSASRTHATRKRSATSRSGPPRGRRSRARSRPSTGRARSVCRTMQLSHANRRRTRESCTSSTSTTARTADAKAATLSAVCASSLSTISESAARQCSTSRSDPRQMACARGATAISMPSGLSSTLLSAAPGSTSGGVVASTPAITSAMPRSSRGVCQRPNSACSTSRIAAGADGAPVTAPDAARTRGRLRMAARPGSSVLADVSRPALPGE